MAHIIVDRRANDKGKSTDNRRRFVRRVRNQIREAVKDTIRNGNITDVITDKGKKVNIPGKGLSQPTFNHSKEGGVSDRVYPGNKEFQGGDRINRPKEGGGGGSGGKKGSKDGSGEDEFSFNLTREEFLDIFFEDMELPDLIKKSITKVQEFENRRAGFSVDGNPSRMNIVRSLKQAKGRRLGLLAAKRRKIKELEKEQASLVEFIVTNVDECEAEKARIYAITRELKVLKRQAKAIPFIDDVDLRFNRWERVPIPTTQAVMFGIMDVSASMGQWEKEMAKRFFMLLYLFLMRNYERVDIVWIRHHSVAKEVDEDEFFNSRETGGTVVSTAIEMMDEIIKDRYPTNQWNIFGCQISDGDNWTSDNAVVVDLMENSILPKSQFYAYVEVDQSRSSHVSDLWPHYMNMKGSFPNLEVSMIRDVKDIYPVFKGLFEKRG